MVLAAARLAEWVGEDGRALTTGGALRPADVPDAARALGVRTPAKVRRAADVPEVHRPWLVAVGAGLVVVADNRAVRSRQPDGPLTVWWSGLQALLTAEAADNFGGDPRVTALTALTAMADGPALDEWAFRRRIGRLMQERGDWDVFRDPQRHGRPHPADAALTLLRLFGAVEGSAPTPLGVWALAEWRRVLPQPITADLPAKELLDLLDGIDESEAWQRAVQWFGGRTKTEIVAELLPCAAEAAPAQRITAIGLIGGLGDDLLPALRAAAEGFPNLAAHVRALAYQYGLTASLDPDDLVWLATEYAHADLVHHGLSAARYVAADYLDAAGFDFDSGGVDRMARCGHPHASEVAAALAPVAGSAVPVQRLKISLSGRCWRRVLIPENATLALLHQVIIVLFGWDDDHLHLFTVGRRHYTDSFHNLDEMAPEDSIRLHQALPRPKATISHTYDFGSNRQHRIELEEVVDGHRLTHPECVGGRGDNPIEYYDPDDPEPAVPFDIEGVNERLKRLAEARH
ncbi:pRiA4b ORF-3-like protein [Lentzea fradiae]|uniref:PRiA4b ORF-3-like protein n=1 Tax=Lentzea fradiae TaxID=200378 RepID=A0A1G8BXN4_9PSEU|nr:pRiA4b ORF-3-like protein [Lentzea fradiae]